MELTLDLNQFGLFYLNARLPAYSSLVHSRHHPCRYPAYPMLPHKFSRPKGTRRRAAFSLVLSLTVMAMLLLLCIGAAALLTVELRVSRATSSYARARLNAMAGARIAFGEIQRLLGPDQRVSATADILCDPTQTDPTQTSYYNNPTNGPVVHPRWVGVWNSGRVSDGSASVPGAAAGEETKVIQRTTDGYLMDSRFANGNDWEKNRAGKTPAGVTKRFEGWLVSGNEAIPGSEINALTPFTPVAKAGSRNNDLYGRLEDVPLVSSGTLGRTLLGPGNRPEGDFMGARAAKVSLPGTSASVGSYAYWVSDEGVKARINLTDKFESITPNNKSMMDGGMCRLLIPQRNDFTLVQNPADVGNSVVWTNYGSVARSVQGGWGRAQDFDDLALIDSSLDVSKVKNFYFNDITFDSAGVASDVVNGGLKKDLTAYFNNAGGDIADYKVAGSGIKGTGAILTDSTLSVISPKVALLYDWYAKSSLGSSDDSGTVITQVPDAVSRNYNISFGSISGPDTVSATYTMATPAYANTKNVAPLSPVLSRFDVYYTHSFTPPNAKWNIRALVYPRIDLWNPYAVPITIPAARVAWLSNTSMTTNIYYQYDSARPIRWFTFGDVTLQPGQAISFVPRGGQDFSATATTGASSAVNIAMVPGTTPNYYLDRAWEYDGLYDAAQYIPDNGTIKYYWPFTVKAPKDYFTAGGGYDEATGAGPVSQVFLTTTGGAVVQQANLDPWCAFATISAYSVVNFTATGYNTPTQDLAGAAASGPVPACHYGYRFMFLDDQSNSGNQPFRNANYNPFVNGNFRATRYTRHPFDEGRVTRVNNNVGTNQLATDDAVSYNSSSIIPSSPGEASPYVSYLSVLNGDAKRYIVLDVPRRSTGLLSLGQLQGAPLVQVPWAPGIPFGNSFSPIQSKDAPSLTARTGYSLGEETAIWNRVNTTAGFNNYIRQQATGTFPWGAASLSGQRTLIDWSYELNHALWDSWMTSGIGMQNRGWTSAEWDFNGLNLASGAIPNSRLVSAGVSVPSGSGYFSDDKASNYAAYRAAYTLLHNGQFNVNSTSVVAWEALLGAFRGIRNPTLDGTSNSANQTPYSRLTVPATGPVPSSLSGYDPSALADQKTWGGFRALDDAEVRKLAQKIVEQVKSRGPFLSLSDFVNRRLIPEGTGSYGTLSTKETNFLGTIQAAINEAGLNAGLSPTSGSVYLDRTIQDVPSLAAAIKPESKVKDKLAGAPGYLLQSDVLQKLGPVLSARSDTFKIRARGESDDGVVAYVEITVQRTPVPLAANNTSASQSLPVNPKSVISGSTYDGNQFFGRRMNIVRTRWLTSDEI